MEELPSLASLPEGAITTEADIEFISTINYMKNFISVKQKMIYEDVHIVSVQDNVTVTDTIKPGALSVFQFHHTNKKRELYIELKALRGETDLFVSTETKRPTAKDFMWNSDSEGDDVIVISPNEMNFKVGGGR